jgi:hypothetical protein
LFREAPLKCLLPRSPPFGNPNFGLTETLSGRNLRQAVLQVVLQVVLQAVLHAVETELNKVGFGVSTTIDMNETMPTKIGVELECPCALN